MPIKKNKINYRLDLTKDLNKIKKSKDRSKAKKEIADFVLAEIELSLKSQISPVTGESFEPLSEKYAKYKQKKVGNKKANLLLFGDMTSNLRADVKANAVEFKITASKEKKKAYNHTVGDTLPRRPLLPDDEKKGGKYATFDESIKRGIKSIIDDYKD